MNYPIKGKNKINNIISYGNRGMKLEALINNSNNYYNTNGIALIFKKPTPIGVVKVSYQDDKKIINKAYFQEQSTLDYNGVYKGKYIDFDVKECISKTSFPLSNIHKHQTEHIKNVIKHQGISFLIIKINNDVYFLDGKDYINFLNSNERKSIPYQFFVDNCILIKEKIYPDLDYIEVIEKLYFKGE